MRGQKRAEERSWVLHQEIANKLRENPDLWKKVEGTLERWKKQGTWCEDLSRWDRMLQEKAREEILVFVASRSEEAIRMRSSSPFVGILLPQERMAIFRAFQTALVLPPSPQKSA